MVCYNKNRTYVWLCKVGCNRMHFIVDFENTTCHGLKGTKYLQKEDKLDIFFSQCCSNIEMEYWEEIMEAGCELHIFKLEKPGHNALDFYIATHIGELFGSGCFCTIAIVSKDKGFAAVRDYWQKAEKGRKIILKPNIEQCILSAGEPSERRKVIQARKKILSLENEYKKYSAHQRWTGSLQEVFGDALTSLEIETLAVLLEKGMPSRALYLNLLQQFGRERGLEVYRKCKVLREEKCIEMGE